MKQALCAGTPPEWWEPGNINNGRALALCRTCPWLGTRCANANPDPREVIVNGTAYDEYGKTIPICDTCGRPWGQTSRASRCTHCAKRPTKRSAPTVAPAPAAAPEPAPTVDEAIAAYAKRRAEAQRERDLAYWRERGRRQTQARRATRAKRIGETVMHTDWTRRVDGEYRPVPCLVIGVEGPFYVLAAIDNPRRTYRTRQLAPVDPTAPELAAYVGKVVRYIDDEWRPEVCIVKRAVGRALILAPFAGGDDFCCFSTERITEVLGHDLRISQSIRHATLAAA